MNSKLLLILLVMFLSFPMLASAKHDDDEILLRPAPGVSIDKINARYNTITDEILLNGSVYKVHVKNPPTLDATVAAMQEDRDILKVEFNYLGETPEGVRRTIAMIDTNPTPSKYRDQDAFVRMRGPEAQMISTGAGVVVAVIDTGVDYTHPDLAAHILSNGHNIIGQDFIDGDNDPIDSVDALDEDEDDQIDEGAGHGTHVAGIIALVAPDAKIMPIRVLNSDGFGSVDNIVQGIDYAVQYAKHNKVPMVINLSLGFPTESFVLLDSIEEALEQGIPVVASAGNDNSSDVHFPAASAPGVLSVASIDGFTGMKAEFSNFGSDWIDVCAPGIGIYSTYLNGGYAWWDGTSMSAPFVTGEAALLLSQLNSDPPITQINGFITSGVDFLYGVNPTFKKGAKLGSGSINLYSALQLVRGADQLKIKKANFSPSKKKITIQATSSASPTAILSVDSLGTMNYSSSSGKYSLKLVVATMPIAVTIRSSSGGIVMAYVAVK